MTPGTKPTNVDDEAPKDGAPEPWDQQRWADDAESSTASMIDWNSNEAAHIEALDKLFVVRALRPIVKKVPKVMSPESMEVDVDESEDVDMGIIEDDLPIEVNNESDPPPLPRNEPLDDNERPLERSRLWSEVFDETMMERSNVVRFKDNIEVYVVPSFFNTYSMAPKDCVIGKNGKVIKLTRQRDQFTGTTRVEV